MSLPLGVQRTIEVTEFYQPGKHEYGLNLITVQCPFILHAYLQHRDTAPVSRDGETPHFIIAPLTQAAATLQSANNLVGLLRRSYRVDGGRLAVPFPAAVSVGWRQVNPLTTGTIEVAAEPHPYDDSAGGLSVQEWAWTAYPSNAQTVQVPPNATRFRTSHADVRLQVNGTATVIPGCITPNSLMHATALTITFGATVAPSTNVGITFLY